MPLEPFLLWAPSVYWQTLVTVPDARKVPNAIYRQTQKVWAFLDTDTSMPLRITRRERRPLLEFELEAWELRWRWRWRWGLCAVGLEVQCTLEGRLEGPPEGYEARDTDREETKQWVFIHDTGHAAPTQSYNPQSRSEVRSTLHAGIVQEILVPDEWLLLSRGRTAQTQNPDRKRDCTPPAPSNYESRSAWCIA
ncbi:hypothetical protein JB92DRAFT_2831245 [Gautieria morchelliformis]|nr:hypothetical protein JB92DRAFT_2831245 [Gautieria morchelliformis]